MKKIKDNIYHLLHPKLSVLITSIDKKGSPNVMSCAWTSPASEIPPIEIICIAKESYTAKLINETKQFVINIPSKKLLKAVWICGSHSGKDTDKFKKAGLKYKKGKFVKAPVIKGSVGYIECKLWKTVSAGECYVFFGKAVYASVDEKYFKKGGWIKSGELPLHLAGAKMVYAK
ncbi:MAG: flavin reductase family protein [Armatimonadota bacterium]